MKRKPWSIIVLALLHVFAPIGNLFVNSYRLDTSPWVLWHHWLYLFPKQLLLANIFLPIAGGLLIYICRKWSYLLYLLTIFVIFAINLENLFSLQAQITFSNILFRCLALVVNLVVVAYVVVPSIRKIYLDPRIRWWEAAPRYTFQVEAEINGVKAAIKNISRGGLFLTADSSFEESNTVQIKWRFDEVEFDLTGRVVYKSARVAVDGYGIQFSHSPTSLKAIKRLIVQLHKAGQMVPDRIPTPAESFFPWLKKLILTGEGLFPRT